jgi:ABC-type antimicrobial peptide transport system permease subunit
MISSYPKVAIRNLYKNKFYAIINIVGLGVAMALCVVGYVNYQFGKSYNSFHENKDSIYLVNSYRVVDGNRQDWSLIPLPMGDAISKEIPGIEKFSRYSQAYGTVRHGDAVFSETISLVDRNFFDMFTFPIIAGSSDMRSDHSGIIITDAKAEKYFGDDNPIGKTLTISTDGENEFHFTVVGIMANPPKNSSIFVRMVVPIERIDDLREDYALTAWDKWSRVTFIQVSDDYAVSGITEKLQPYTDICNEANEDFELNGFFLTSLPDLSSIAHDLRGQYFNNMHPAALMGPTVTAFLVLLLACFNFINTAIAFALRRMREIGIRKTIGGMRGQLVLQFLGENLILCFIAMLLAAILAEVFVPAYDSLWPELSLTMNYSENLDLVGFFVGLLIFTAIAAGAYPAFYISNFKPIDILRSKQKIRGSNPLIRVLLTFQLALSMTSIIAAVILNQNADYIRNMDHGFDRENIMVVPIDGENDYTLMRDALIDHQDIASIGVTRHLMGRYYVGSTIKYEDLEKYIHLFQLGENYFETSGLTLLQGRAFDPDLTTDANDAIMVNEKMVSAFGWKEPIGLQVTIIYSDSERVYNVIGVIEDFYPNGINSKIRPTALSLASPDKYNYMTVKCGSNDPIATAAYIEDTWKRVFPNMPYEGMWFEETHADEMEVNNSIRLVFLYIAVMVVIISSMGLFALVSLNISKRTKEIGIRKVLGATISNIGVLVCREFILLIIIGSFLAAAMGYFLVGSLLSSIWDNYVPFSLAPYLIAPILVLVVALMSVSFRVVAAATSNPVETLRYE